MCKTCELIKEINNYQSDCVNNQARVSIIETAYAKDKNKIAQNIKGTLQFKSFVPKFCPECGRELTE
jgi:hypothetical protein